MLTFKDKCRLIEQALQLLYYNLGASITYTDIEPDEDHEEWIGLFQIVFTNKENGASSGRSRFWIAPDVWDPEKEFPAVASGHEYIEDPKAKMLPKEKRIILRLAWYFYISFKQYMKDIEDEIWKEP